MNLCQIFWFCMSFSRFIKQTKCDLNVTHKRDFAQSSKATISFSWIVTFFRGFLPLPTVLSPQIRSGSYKNSYRKLRVCSIRSQILVNGCWPFRQHIDTLRDCIFEKWPRLLYEKSVFSVLTSGCVRKHDLRSLYCRNWKL